jgi:predicted RNA-binding protein YlxR (DUF448 family)
VTPGAPIRSCVACGRKAPQGELLRFAARDGQLIAGKGGPGRGAYTCKRIACFERARTGRGFSRVLRTTVDVQPGLRSLYTDGT